MSAIGMPGMMLVFMLLAGGTYLVHGIISGLLPAHTISLGMY